MFIDVRHWLQRAHRHKTPGGWSLSFSSSNNGKFASSRTIFQIKSYLSNVMAARVGHIGLDRSQPKYYIVPSNPVCLRINILTQGITIPVNVRQIVAVYRKVFPLPLILNAMQRKLVLTFYQVPCSFLGDKLIWRERTRWIYVFLWILLQICLEYLVCRADGISKVHQLIPWTNKMEPFSEALVG